MISNCPNKMCFCSGACMTINAPYIKVGCDKMTDDEWDDFIAKLINSKFNND